MSAFVYLDSNGQSTSSDDEAFMAECQRQWANPLPQWNIFTPPVLKKLAQALQSLPQSLNHAVLEYLEQTGEALLFDDPAEQQPKPRTYQSPFAHPYQRRINSGGNYCGHYPQAPNFVMRTNPYETDSKTDDLGQKRHSAIFYEITDRIKEYYDDPNVIPMFNTANHDKRKTERQRNSARREALVNLTCVMVMHMDLCSLRVGYPSKDGFVPRSIKWLAKKAELSYSRAKRAMADLNDSGILFSFQYRELIDKESKSYKFYVASRAFSVDFFEVLGINLKRLGAARKWAGEKLEKAANEQGVDKKAMAMLKLAMNKIENRLGRSAKKANGQLDEDEYNKAKRLNKRRNELVIQFRTETPDLFNDTDALMLAINQCLFEEGLIDAVPS